MYVCVCHAVTDRDISKAVAGGARTMRDLREQTGLGGTCGRCAQCARACLQEAHASTPEPAKLFASLPALTVA